MKEETNRKIFQLWESARPFIRIPDPIHSKLKTLKWAALRWWGVLFRAIFISSLGLGGYFWLDPQPLGDIPLSQLTLNQIFANTFALIISVSCFCWFFNFPKQEKNLGNPDDSPYVVWGMFGILLMFLAAFIVAVLYAAWA